MNLSFAPTSPNYEPLVTAVRHATGLGSQVEAADALRATLETIAEFAPPDEAAHLATHLPLELRASLLAPAEIPAVPTFGEFCCRLTVRTNTELLVALALARGVLRALMRCTGPASVRTLFPAGFEALFADS
jgi:uncharacterized protein (DUF2267 family)